MVATNAYMGSTCPGLAYGGSKDLREKLDELVLWGTPVDCVDEGLGAMYDP
jgi:hypothetical protein